MIAIPCQPGVQSRFDCTWKITVIFWRVFNSDWTIVARLWHRVGVLFHVWVFDRIVGFDGLIPALSVAPIEGFVPNTPRPLIVVIFGANRPEKKVVADAATETLATREIDDTIV